MTLVQNTGIPAVLGFEFYPVAFLPPENWNEKDSFEAQGFQIQPSSQRQIHTPGQLAIYPVIPLQSLKISIDDLKNILKEATQTWLQSRRIESKYFDQIMTLQEPALFINISNDLSQSSQGATSLSEQGQNIDLKQAFDAWILHFTAALLKALPAAKT